MTSSPPSMTIDDAIHLAALELFASGWAAPDIALALGLATHEVLALIDADAEAFPDAPLRVTLQ